jgi:hypothetical protein
MRIAATFDGKRQRHYGRRLCAIGWIKPQESKMKLMGRPEFSGLLVVGLAQQSKQTGGGLLGEIELGGVRISSRASNGLPLDG